MGERKVEIKKGARQFKNELIYTLITQLKGNLKEIINENRQQQQQQQQPTQDDGPSTSTRTKSRLRRYAATELAQLERKEKLQRAMDAYSDGEDTDYDEDEVERHSPRSLFEAKSLRERAEATAPSIKTSTVPGPKNYQRLKEQRVKKQQERKKPSTLDKEKQKSLYIKRK